MNYQKVLETTISNILEEGKIPSLLLHACCAPCSSYCLEYLSQYFSITIYYYNPNITDKLEYQKRVEEQKRFIKELHTKYPVTFLEGPYEPSKFYQIAKGLEEEPEGQTRCFRCYGLRLEQTAHIAQEQHYDYFTTTLSLSPYKNSEVLNRIGKTLEEKYKVPYLYSDFKKKNGYQRSIQLSRQYQLYRQDYCGCEYSKQEREKKERSE